MDCLMGIDLGSTSFKAVVFDTNGRMVALGRRAAVVTRPRPEHPEWAVWDPDDVWRRTAQAVREALDRASANAGARLRVLGIAVTGMGMDGVPVNEAGETLYPFISWHDPRTVPQAAFWDATIGAERIYALTGFTIQPICSVNRVMWVAEHEPEIYRQTFKWLLIEDFVNYRLTGRMVTDYTMAATTLALDCRTLSWSNEILDRAGVRRDIFADPRPSATFVGEVTEAAARDTGLPPGAPVFLGGHDNQCAALAASACTPGVTVCVMGTWEIMMEALNEPRLGREGLGRGVVCVPHVVPGTYCLKGYDVAGGVLEWYRRCIFAGPGGCPPESERERDRGAEDEGEVTVRWDTIMAEAAASPPGARGVFLLPHLFGATCPHRDPSSLGAFLGLSSVTSRGDLTRAVLEGLCYEFREVAEALWDIAGRRPDRVVAVGGPTQNELWMQIKADVMGAPVEVLSVTEGTALGAAMLAGIGAGVYGDAGQAHRDVLASMDVVTHVPDTGRAALYDERYRRVYLALYRELRSTTRAIRALQDVR